MDGEATTGTITPDRQGVMYFRKIYDRQATFLFQFFYRGRDLSLCVA